MLNLRPSALALATLSREAHSSSMDSMSPPQLNLRTAKTIVMSGRCISSAVPRHILLSCYLAIVLFCSELLAILLVPNTRPTAHTSSQ